MSYINRNSRQARSGAWIAVAALHGAALYALINGLGIDYIKQTIVNLPARNYDTPPPPPEPMPEPPRDTPRDRADDVVTPAVPRVPVDGSVELNIPIDPPTLPPITPPPIPGRVTPTTTPKFRPVGATPRTSPGGWVSTNDYPTRDIRQGNEGTAVFRLSIAADGNVTGCEITRSSGHPGLDEATCRNISRRARFEPARDENGERVAGSYSGKITWVIPR